MERGKFVLMDHNGMRWANEFFDNMDVVTNFCKTNNITITPSLVSIKKEKKKFLLYDTLLLQSNPMILNPKWTTQKFNTPEEVYAFIKANNLRFTLDSVDEIAQ